MIRDAVVLAGGLGTRLGKLVADIPKPMLPIGNRPFLALLLEYLEKEGIASVILCVGYLHDTVVGYFGERFGQLQLRYSIETQPLGTGGAIARALRAVDAECAFVLNGDTFVKLSYAAMGAAHAASGAAITVAARRVPDVSRYGELVLHNWRVAEFREKEGPHPGLVNSGVYVVNRTIFDGYRLPPVFSFERDFLKSFSAEIRPAAFLIEDYFIDIGIPEDYERAQRDLSR